MMAHNGVRQRTTANGRWLPPKALGHNIKWQQPGVSTPVFYHDGHATGPKNLPCNAREYKVYSIYHDQAVFWTVDYDATRKPVADGQDFDAANGGDRHPNDESDSESSSDDEELDDWRPLSFNPLEGNTQLISYAGRRLQSRTLLVQRPDQTWVNQLLPHTYQASPERRTRNTRYGGMVGELPLLIGLAAMSLPPMPRPPSNYSVHTLLPYMIVNPTAGNQIGSWRVFPQVPQCAGCTSSTYTLTRSDAW